MRFQIIAAALLAVATPALSYKCNFAGCCCTGLGGNGGSTCQGQQDMIGDNYGFTCPAGTDAYCCAYPYYACGKMDG